MSCLPGENGGNRDSCFDCLNSGNELTACPTSLSDCGSCEITDDKNPVFACC